MVADDFISANGVIINIASIVTLAPELVNDVLCRLLACCRQTATYSPEFEPDIVVTEPQPRHRTPPAWMRLYTPFGDRRRWQRNFALGGSIKLHWAADLIAFSRTKAWAKEGDEKTIGRAFSPRCGCWNLTQGDALG